MEAEEKHPEEVETFHRDAYRFVRFDRTNDPIAITKYKEAFEASVSVSCCPLTIEPTHISKGRGRWAWCARPCGAGSLSIIYSTNTVPGTL